MSREDRDNIDTKILKILKIRHFVSQISYLVVVTLPCCSALIRQLKINASIMHDSQMLSVLGLPTLEAYALEGYPGLHIHICFLLVFKIFAC